jgi:MFS family permease
MQHQAKGLTYRLKGMLGGNKLGGSYYQFLLAHTCFLLSNRLPGIFINTLLLGQSNDLTVVLTYQATFFIGSAIAMLLAAYLLHSSNSGVTAGAGIVGYNILYLLLIVLGGDAFRWNLWLGLLAGLADGCYWLSYGHLLSDATTLSNRDSGIAIVSIFANIVNLVIPLFAGSVISAVGGSGGYITVFAMAFVMSFVAGALVLRLPKRHMAGGPKVDYRYTLRAIRQNKNLMFALLGQGSKGIREGAFTFILSLVLFQMIASEVLIGFSTFLSAAAAILSFVIASHILTRLNRVRFMGYAVVGLTSIAALCVFRLSPVMVIAFSILNSFFASFLDNSCYGTFLDRMEMIPELSDHRPELLAINDTMLETGRIIGLGIILGMNAWIGGGVQQQVWSLLLLTALQLITVLLCRRAVRPGREDHQPKEEM